MADVGYVAAFGGGVVSFLSPCVLPIVPAYLSIITGVDVAEIEHGGRRQLTRIGRDTSLFIAGFSAVLGSVLAVAATEARATQGGLLLAAYSAGLGVPFLAAGLAFGRLAGAFGWVKCHLTAVTVAAAGCLAFFGVLLTLNRLTWVTSQLQAAFGHIGLHRFVFLG